jgi:hypothetical protein
MSTILRLPDGAMFDRIPSTNAVPQAPFKRLKRAGKGERPFVTPQASSWRESCLGGTPHRRFPLRGRQRDCWEVIAYKNRASEDTRFKSKGSKETQGTKNNVHLRAPRRGSCRTSRSQASSCSSTTCRRAGRRSERAFEAWKDNNDLMYAVQTRVNEIEASLPANIDKLCTPKMLDKLVQNPSDGGLREDNTMNLRLLPAGAAAGFLTMIAVGPMPAAATPCTNLKFLQLQQSIITSAKDTTFPGVPAFCRVTATLKPTSDSTINIEVWLPEKS